MTAKLKAHQNGALLWARSVERPTGCARILQAPPGSGKTAVAVQWARSQPTLVIAPLPTLISEAVGWQAEWRRWTEGWDSLTALRRKDAIPATAHAIAVPTTDVATRAAELGQWLRRFSTARIVVDECHRCRKSGASKTGKTVHGDRGPGLLMLAGGGVLAMSATPMPNGRPAELIPWSHPSWYDSAAHWGLMKEHCRQRNRWSPTGWDFQGSINVEGYLSNLRGSGILHRITASDLVAAGDLPPTQHRTIAIPRPKDDPDLPDAMALEILEAVREGRQPKGGAQVAQYRRAAGLAKAKPSADAAVVDLDAEGEKGAPALILAFHRDVAELVCAHLRENGHEVAGPILGGQDGEDRERAAADFREGRARFLVGTIGALGTGIDGLHKRTSKAYMLELPWVPGEVVQSAGRVARIGGVATEDAPAEIIHIATANGIDDRIAATLEEKAFNGQMEY